ncbi:DUF4381 domain-containing protein [Rheinheimera maricola]|uniref:DUF4381 domain-containing protein n=1 Tax=Rheinheimera maricola TaxID=2793282 RepID=A0ABS7XAE3_9GAMM|nr:DUF4381 domain-containing protein [Rheinheimera maricola]MBZ9611698.1 DUF4381 domain-containing protein [Rheinheimera maricola]
MAETQSALEQLADISEPALVSNFALAPVWWFVLVLSLAGLLYLALSYYWRWRHLAAKREALKLLELISLQPDAASQINQLLKRVLRHYQPTHTALNLSGAAWQDWLAQQHQLPLPDLSRLLYQAQQDTAGNELLYQFAKAWLTAYRGEAPAPQSQQHPEGLHHA